MAQPHKPAESKLNTIVVPPTGRPPALLYQAAAVPLRVVVRNVGGTNVLLAHETMPLESPANNTTGTFQLPPNTSETFVLMARQSLLAGAVGAGGIVSIAVSEALPLAWAES